MIVTEDNIHKALQYLAEDPHPLALARKDTTNAENKAKQIYASAFLAANGSVAAKEATATIDPAHIAAKEEEAEAIKELERHRARARAAEMLIDVWRSENANARVAERVR